MNVLPVLFSGSVTMCGQSYDWVLVSLSTRKWACPTRWLQGSDEIMVVESIIVMILLCHPCLDIIGKGEPFTLKSGGSFLEKL